MNQDTIDRGLAELLCYVLKCMAIFYYHALRTKIQFTVDDIVVPWGAFISCVFSQELWLGAWPSLPKAAESGFGSRAQRCCVWLTNQTKNTSKKMSISMGPAWL
jgi:hypothetical protein